MDEPAHAPAVVAAIAAWVEKRGHPVPDWVARKAALDYYDDGGGLGCYDGRETFQDEFLAWARENMGQGYSLAIEDGVFLDIVTAYCYRGYVEGRRAGRP